MLLINKLSIPFLFIMLFTALSFPACSYLDDIQETKQRLDKVEQTSEITSDKVEDMENGIENVKETGSSVMFWIVVFVLTLIILPPLAKLFG